MVLQTTETPAQAALNSVYFGPQTGENKNGVLTHPMGGHQAGHCHTFSCCVSTFYKPDTLSTPSVKALKDDSVAD